MLAAKDPDEAIGAQVDAFAAAVGPHLAPDEPYALVDFPDHHNIGDSAIYAGELAFLDAHARRPPSYVCSIRTYRQDIALFCPEGPILLHGGGNFGDIWPSHQALRHDVIATYRHRKVVQLAQSIHFDDPAAIAETARVIGAHPDFTLLVRDEPSRDLAAKHFDCAVQLCPDAAYNLRRLSTSTEGSLPILSVMRLDREKTDQAARAYLESVGPIADWPESDRSRRPLVRRLIERKVAPRFPRSAGLMRRRERLYREQAMGLVRSGVRHLEPGRVIVSDRLHAHIIASLIRRPHVVLDNYYGKIARYIACWGDDGLATPAASPEELERKVEAIRADRPAASSATEEGRRNPSRPAMTQQGT